MYIPLIMELRDFLDNELVNSKHLIKKLQKKKNNK